MPRKRSAKAMGPANDGPRLEDSTRAPKSARTRYDQSGAPGSSQTDAIYVDDDDEEADASQDAPDASQGYNEHAYSYGLYGAVQEKIVGVRYYNGYATLGEMVMCRREPNNAYDRKLSLRDEPMTNQMPGC